MPAKIVFARPAGAFVLLGLVLAVGCSSSRSVETLTVTAHEQKLTPDNYDAIVKSAKPALIDFSAAWCGPCQAVKPDVEALAREMDGELVVAIADMTERGKAAAAPVAAAWNIEAYPTFVLVREGQELARHEGAPGDLKGWVRSNL